MLKIALHPSFQLSLPEGHRFPMIKYALLPEQLLYEGTCHQDNFFTPEKANKETIVLTHNEAYYQALATQTLDKQIVRAIGFPLSIEMFHRELYIAQGTIEAALYALEFGIAANIAGGTHHAYSDRGAGFCIFNDNAVAANYLLENKLAKKILIIDLDVHQGNGTASIFRDNATAFTFSMHGATNYPFHKEQSDWDIPLPDNMDDATYLNILRNALPKLIDEVQPDFIFYQCGVDILGTDKMGKLNCTIPGVKERDKLVLTTAFKNKIPLVFDMGGGYSPDIKDIVTAHANTYRLAQEIYF